MSYSVIRFEGSIQTVLDEELVLQDAADRARADTGATWSSTKHITAVVDESNDTVVWEHIYQDGRRLDRTTINSIAYGLSRFM